MKKDAMLYRLNPAWGVARLCARNGQSGPRALAEIAGVDRSTVFAWFRPIERNGTGGTIPANKQKRIYFRARQRGINITAEQIIGVDDTFFDEQAVVDGQQRETMGKGGRRFTLDGGKNRR
jgi:hypothetical protein